MADGGVRENLESVRRFGFGRLFWLTHEAVVGADVRSERIVLWNPSAERIFGYAEDEAIGMPLDRLVPVDLMEAHHAGVARFRDNGAPRLVGGPPVEVEAIRKDGSSLAASLTLTAVADDRRYVVAVIRDVTEQRAAERARERAYEAMRVFLAAASHDLRSPLTTISGFAHLLVEHEATMSTAERTDMAGRILRASNHAARLVDDLLTVSEIEAGVVEARPKVVPVAAAVRDASAVTGISVEVDDPAATAVLVDRDHLQRILVNLLVNASKHGRPPMSVATTTAGAHVRIHVCDAGDGIPADLVETLFQPFTRAATANGVGSGLGLSIVQGLAAANGGDVAYERHAGSSCFIVTLPAAADVEQWG